MRGQFMTATGIILFATALALLPADAWAACDVVITSKPPNPSSSSSASFSFTVSDCGRGVIQCKLDADSYTTCSSPKGYSFLQDKSHTFTVRFLSSTLFVLDAESWTWTVDTTAPDTSITDGPGFTNDTTPTFSFTSTETGGSYACAVDAGAYSTCSSPRTLGVQTVGAHTFYVRHTDAAGNTDGSPASRSFTIDLTAPDTTITSSPSSPTTSSTLTFAFTATESVLRFDCSLDAAVWSTCSSPASLGPVSDGLHEFRVRAVDPAGNIDASPAFADVLVNAESCQ